jgi:hypothetical protein
VSGEVVVKPGSTQATSEKAARQVASPGAQIASFNIPPHSGDGQPFFALNAAH